MTTITLKTGDREKFIPVILLGLMLLTIVKDLLHSFIKDYNFYLSESMLFGMFWLLFVPFALINKKLLIRDNQMAYVLIPIISSALHICIFALMVFTISGLFFNHTFGFSGVLLETFADHGLSCLLIYGALSFIFPLFQQTTVVAKRSSEKIRVTHQNGTVLLAKEEIVYVRTERPYVALVTIDKTYLHNSTLQDFIDDNATDSFCRIHKSTIINTNYVSSYKSRKNGDYDVFMHNGDTLRVSRNFNSYFKSFSKVSG